MNRRTRMLPALTGAIIIAALLSGCGGSGSSSPTATASSAAPTPAASTTPTARPSPTTTPSEPTAPAVLPASCDAVGTAAVLQEAVGDMTLQSDGVGFIRPVPQNASLALGCDWIVGDSTGMLLLISTAAPADVTAAVSTLPGLGYTCGVSDDFGANYCQKAGSSDDTEEQIVDRDGVWIYLSTSNRSGRALLSDLATQIWG